MRKKLCHINTDSFMAYIKTGDIYKDIPKDIEIRSDTLNYELDRLLPKEKKWKVTGLMKDRLGKKIMIKFVGVGAKIYSYLIDNGSEDKKNKRHKNMCHKEKTF